MDHILGTVGQGLFVLELAIYSWILYNLWKHDEKNHQEGIITKDMKKERNQKNVITLKGQVMMFTVETVFHIYTIFHISNHAMIESSFMPITEIVASSIISVIQLTTSNEMRRFLKNQFNFY